MLVDHAARCGFVRRRQCAERVDDVVVDGTLELRRLVAHEERGDEDEQLRLPAAEVAHAIEHHAEIALLLTHGDRGRVLAGAGDHLYEQLSDQYAEAFCSAAGRASDRQRLRAGLRLLWEIYQRPHYTAVLELNAAARSDAELFVRLRDVGARHRELALAASKTFFPALGRERAERCIETIHAAFVGLRAQGALIEGGRYAELVLSGLEDLVASQLRTDVRDKE